MRKTEGFELRMFFMELLQLAFKYDPMHHRYGNPCSWLLEQMCMYNNKLVNKILSDTSGESHEVRLNNAGLKMYWRMTDGRFTVHISGDQVAFYTEFVDAARLSIIKHGFLRKRGA